MNLAGRIRLRPGMALPTIVSTRPLLAARIARGRPAGELPAVLGALFSMCAHAQRGTARRAVAAAAGEPARSSSAERAALQAATAREQALRIAQDWHRLLPGAPAAAPTAALRGCPLWDAALAPAEQVRALPAWLSRHWLGEPVAAWLAAHAADPAAWAERWCTRVDTAPARLLRSQRQALQDIATPIRPLRLLDQPLATLPHLARRMAEETGFCAEPDWQGTPAETGPWTRSVDPAPPAPHNAWMRLIARLVDLLHLAVPAGCERLAEGALTLGRHESVAWTETARGLLVHWVRLEDAPQGARVADCRVLAPTEWNFHPRGVLARTLASLTGDDRAAQAARAAAAFDPCVEFEVESTMEPAHA